MKKKSKGIIAFSWYFIVLSVSVFSSNLIFLIGELLNAFRPTLNENPLIYYFPKLEASTLDWLTAIVGLWIAGRLFLVGVDLLNDKLKSLKDLNFSAYSFIIYYLLIAAEAVRAGLSGEAYFASYSVSASILNIMLWIFVMKFFKEREGNIYTRTK